MKITLQVITRSEISFTEESVKLLAKQWLDNNLTDECTFQQWLEEVADSYRHGFLEFAKKGISMVEDTEEKWL